MNAGYDNAPPAANYLKGYFGAESLIARGRFTDNERWSILNNELSSKKESAMRKLFLTHPHHAGETYIVHFKFAIWAGLQMILAGLICLTHAVFPFLFEHTASGIIIPLADKLSGRVETVRVSKKRKKDAKSKK